MNAMQRKIGIGLLSAAVALVTTACSGNVSVSGNDVDQGTITYETDTGKEMTISSEEKLPESFPADIPFPDGMTVTASTSSPDSGNTTVTFETTLPFDQLVQIYEAYAGEAGYEEMMKMNEEGSYSYSGSRGDESFFVNMALDLEDNKTVTGALVYDKKMPTE